MQTYSIEIVIADVGWLNTRERVDIQKILGHDSSIHFDQASGQVHLHWRTEADTVDAAWESSRTTLRDAASATGVYAPRTTFLSVREINQ